MAPPKGGDRNLKESARTSRSCPAPGRRLLSRMRPVECVGFGRSQDCRNSRTPSRLKGSVGGTALVLEGEAGRRRVGNPLRPPDLRIAEQWAAASGQERGGVAARPESG